MSNTQQPSVEEKAMISIKDNTTWNAEIKEEEIYNRRFSTGYLIQSNQHLEIFRTLKDLVLSTYLVKAEFEYLGFNGYSIYANGQRLVWRNSKTSNFSLGKNVLVVKHNLSTKGGGSNKYPSVAYQGAKIILEFISYGLPTVDRINGWSIHVMGITKLTS